VDRPVIRKTSRPLLKKRNLLRWKYRYNILTKTTGCPMLRYEFNDSKNKNKKMDEITQGIFISNKWKIGLW
jgi:hypothetical protein